MKLRPEVRAFAEAMEARLRANERKGSWHAMSLYWLHGRLQAEVAELSGAMFPYRVCPRCQRDRSAEMATLNPAMVLHEAADVANFAMMIADNAGGLLRRIAQEPTPEA